MRQVCFVLIFCAISILLLDQLFATGNKEKFSPWNSYGTEVTVNKTRIPSTTRYEYSYHKGTIPISPITHDELKNNKIKCGCKQ